MAAMLTTVPPALAFDQDDIWVEFTSDEFPSPPDNLHLYLEVRSSSAAIASVHSPYASDGKTQINLSGLLAPAPVLPNELTILPDPPGLHYGEATGAVLTYFLRFGEKSGIPSTLGPTDDSSYYKCLPGARARDANPVGTPYVRLLHRYGVRNTPGHAGNENEAWPGKPIAADQPDYAYVMPLMAITETSESFTVRWTQGGNTTFAVPSADHAMDGNKVYWYAVGPAQTGILDATPPVSGAEIIGWTWRLTGIAAGQSRTLAEIEYRLDTPSPHQIALAYANGAGGIEICSLRGAARWSWQVSKENTRMLRGQDFSVKNGEYKTFNSEARHRVEASTGWIPRAYAEHLRQALLSRHTWIADPKTNKFYACEVAAGETPIHYGDNDLWQLNFVLSPAWVDRGF